MERYYFSTFTTGFKEIIHDVVKNTLKDVYIKLLLDGLIVYTTSSSIETVKDLHFFNNTFLLVKKFDTFKKDPITEMSEYLANLKSLKLEITIPSKYKTFRITTSSENTMVPIDPALMDKMNQKVESLTNLKLNKSNPNVEFWILHRSEGYGFIGMRLTRNSSSKSREKGELRSEISMIMSLLSEPSDQDIILDPFAGTGAIPLERVKIPYQKIIISDIDSILISKIKYKIKGLKKVIVINSDIFELKNHLEAISIDKIITDPPWGNFLGKDINLYPFYFDMMESFYELLKPEGIIVILIENKNLFEKVVSKLGGKFLIEKKYDTLISGRKARLYKIRKV